MKEIVGKKIGMTRVFLESGESIPVTVIEAGPCPVVARKTVEKDGYDAYQVGFGVRKKNRTNKPMNGHFAKANVEPTQVLREVQFDEELEVGSEIKVTAFEIGSKVDVTGISRGLGFAGVMKRYGFSGANRTHGQSDTWRVPGSIGQGSDPSRVFKGKKLPGKMGRDKITTMGLQVVQIVESENLMMVKGPIPGHRGSYVKIRTSNRG